MKELESGNTKSVGIVFADVNQLKQLNDEYGHRYGDSVLIQSAIHIQHIFGRENAFRIGGGEFVVLAAGLEQSVLEEKIHALVENASGAISIGSAWSNGAEYV